MKYILWFILLCFNLTTSSQTYQIEKDVYPDVSETGKHLILSEDGNYVFMSHRCEDFTVDCPSLHEINSDGDILRSIMLPWLDANSDPVFLVQDTFYWAAHNNEGSSRYILHAMSSDFDSLWTTEFAGDFNQLSQNTSAFYNDQIVIAGLIRDSQDIIQGITIWFDKSGELDTIIDFDFEDKEIVFTNATIDEENDLLVMGYSYNGPFGSMSGYLKYNSEKELVYNWSGVGQVATSLPHPIVIDENIITSYEYLSKISIISIGIDSTINWAYQLESDLTEKITIFNVSKTTNGEILACGWYVDLLGEQVLNGFVIRLDDEGNEIWRRIYKSVNNDGSINSSEFFSIRELPDGNLLMTGGVRKPHDYNGDTLNYRDFWLVRTDEYGCIIEGCNDTTSVSGLLLQNNVLSISPNPSNGIIFVSHSFDTNKEIQWSLFDNTGREVKSGIENAHSNEFSIDVYDVANGIYNLLLVCEGQRVARKVAVVK